VICGYAHCCSLLTRSRILRCVAQSVVSNGFSKRRKSCRCEVAVEYFELFPIEYFELFPLFTIGVCRSRQVSVCSDPWTHRFALFIRPRCAAQSGVSSGFSKRRRSTAASRRCEVFVGHFEYRFGRDVPHLYRVQWTSGGRWSCQINYLPKHNHSYLRICVWNLESSTIRGFDWRE